jgi:hypothetical protein
VGGHAHASQAFLFQEVDLVYQGSHLGGFKRSRLFIPSPLEFRESDNKWREAGLMVLTIEPGLEAYTPDNLPIGGAWLVFQEK